MVKNLVMLFGLAVPLGSVPVALAAVPAASLESVASEPAARVDDSGRYAVMSVELRNAGFDAPPEASRPCPTGWFCTVHANPNAFRFEVVSAPGGNRYLRVSRLFPEPWALGRQTVPVSVQAGDRLRLSMLVNTEAVEGVAGPKIVLNDGSGNVLKAESSLSKPLPGWRKIIAEIEVVPGTARAEVGFMIEGGG